MRNTRHVLLQDSSGGRRTEADVYSKLLVGQDVALRNHGVEDWQDAMVVVHGGNRPACSLLAPGDEIVVELLGGGVGRVVTRVGPHNGQAPYGLSGHTHQPGDGPKTGHFTYRVRLADQAELAARTRVCWMLALQIAVLLDPCNPSALVFSEGLAYKMSTLVDGDLQGCVLQLDLGRCYGNRAGAPGAAPTALRQWGGNAVAMSEIWLNADGARAQLTTAAEPVGPEAVREKRAAPR